MFNKHELISLIFPNQFVFSPAVEHLLNYLIVHDCRNIVVL